MDSLQSGEQQPSSSEADGNSNSDGGGGNHHHPSSTSNNVTNHHFHDSFGEADSGVDYGPPIELEEDEEKEQHEGTNIHDIITAADVDSTKLQHDDNVVDGIEIQNLSPPNQTEEEEEEVVDNHATTTIITLEETVGLHEATLESLHDKLSKLNDEINVEEQTSSMLHAEIETLNKKKIVLKKRTENNVQLVKELEGTLEKCLERLRRALDANVDDDEDVDTKEEGKLDQLLLQVGNEVITNEKDHAVVMVTEATNEIQTAKDATKDYDDFNIIKIPIKIVEEDRGSIAWPPLGSKDVKAVRKEAASLPFAFPVWRTSEFSCALLFTNLDSSQLLLDMMDMTVLEHLLCREENKLDGCGQVQKSKIWGTSLDVMTQVKWEHLLPSLQRDILFETPTVSSESRLDPNVQLCPYELGGTCADDRCPYQHISRPEPFQDEVVEDSAQDDEVIKYHSLSKLTLPPSPFSDSKRAPGDEVTEADDVDLSSKQTFALGHSDEELDSSVVPTNQQCFEDNDDYVSLPTVAETTSGHVVYNNSRDLKFSERFWWYKEHPFGTSWSGDDEAQDVFQNVVTSFGFRRNSEFIEYRALPSLEDYTEGARLQKELIVDARLIDLCRVCIHMGQASFALTVLETFQKSVHKDRLHMALKLVRRKVESSVSCNSSQNIFDSQLTLLVISKYIRAKFLKPDMMNSNLQSSMDSIFGQKKDKRYEDLFQSLVSRFPKRQKLTSAHREDKWAALERSVHSLLEKQVIVPFSQLTNGEEYSFFLNCVHIGKILETVVYELSQEHGTSFSPLLHALEPIWESLQTLLQTSYALSRATDWLQPDLIVTVIIGPIIYACASTTIAVTVLSQHGQQSTRQDADKSYPNYDMRTIANMTCLDKCIVGILKDLNKSSQKNEEGELVELLVTPLHALSVGISMAVGMVDKAQMKLGYALSKGRNHRGVPSMYSISSILWGQLVQIQITFPPNYNSALRYEHIIPSLAPDVVTSHRDIVSRLFEHGVILHSIALPGDFQITTSLLSTKGSKDQYKAVWEDVKREIYAQRSLQEGQTETVNELDLVVANYMKEYSCFPETLFLTGGKLTRLRMTNCGLKELPKSFGFCFSHLQV